MTRSLVKRLAALLALLMLASGCSPVQPFYFHEDGDLSHYLETAQEIEYPDVDSQSLPETTEAHEPLTISNAEFYEFWDLTLEDAIAIALQNSEVIRNIAQINQSSFQRNGLAAVSNAASVYDPAVVSSSASPNAQQVDGNGNRLLSRGAARANPGQGVEDALAEFDAQFFSSVRLNTTDRARNVGPNNPFNPVEFQSDDFNALTSISKRTATGGVWTLRSRADYNLNNVQLGVGRALPSDWTATLELEVNHPLLRGRGAEINRIPIVLARINEDISLADLEAAVRDLVIDVESTYWNLYCAYQILEANRQGLEAAQTAAAKDEARTGKRDPREQVARTREQYFFFRGQMEASLGGSNLPGGDLGVQGLERRLRFLMGLAPTDGRVIRPVDKPTLAKLSFDWRELRLETLFRSPELRRQKWVIKQRELEMLSARNQLLPELNLNASYRFVGNGDQLYDSDRRGLNFPAEGSTAWDELTEGRYQEGGVSLTFTPSAVGSRRPRAGVRNAQLRLITEQRRMEEMELLSIHNITQVLGQLDSHYHLAQSALNQLIAASDEVRSLEAKQDRVERLFDQLYDAYRRRANARIAFERAVCEYNRLIAQVHYHKGSLLEYCGIHMQEGPWPKKAYWDALGRARERDASYYLDYGTTEPGVVSRGPVPQAGGLPAGAAPIGAGSLPAGEVGELLPEATEILESLPGLDEAAPQPTGPLPTGPATGSELPAPPAVPLTRRPTGTRQAAAFDWEAGGGDAQGAKRAKQVAAPVGAPAAAQPARPTNSANSAAQPAGAQFQWQAGASDRGTPRQAAFQWQTGGQ